MSEPPAGADSSRRTEAGRSAKRIRLFSFAFVLGLVVAALAFVVAAVGASDEDRGGYTGMAVLWGAGALAAAALMIAIERKGPRD